MILICNSELCMNYRAKISMKIYSLRINELTISAYLNFLLLITALKITCTALNEVLNTESFTKSNLPRCLGWNELIITSAQLCGLAFSSNEKIINNLTP